MKNLKFKKEKKLSPTLSGQVALMVLLVSAVVMTLGLSMSSTTKIETKIDSDEESLKKAFNAAESAIEYYQATEETSYSSDSRTEASVEVLTLGGGQELELTDFISANRVAYFWLCGHDGDGNIDETVLYGEDQLSVCVDTGFNGALKIDYFYKSGGIYQVERRGIDLGGLETVSDFPNQLVDVDNCVDVSVSGEPLLLAVTPLSVGSMLRIKGNADFPFQGEEIVATGTIDGSVNQKVRVSSRFTVPEFLLEGITAEGSVLSN